MVSSQPKPLPISSTSSSIVEFIRARLHEAQEPKKVKGEEVEEKRIDAASYVNMIREMLDIKEIEPQAFAEAVLTEDMLNNQLKRIRRGMRKGVIMGARKGDIIQLAVIPFPNNLGYYSLEKIKQGEHLVALRKGAGGRQRVIAGLIHNASNVDQFLPFSDCKFTLECDPTENPERVAKQYEEAFMKLRKQLADHSRHLHVTS